MQRWLKPMIWGMLGLTAFLGFGCSAGGKGEPIAWIKEPVGKVEARVGSQGGFVLVKESDPLAKGSAVRTGPDGTTRVRFPDSSEAMITPESYLEITYDSVLASQKSGRAIYQFEKQKAPTRIETPHGVTAVLGTKFMISIDANSTMVAVEEGKVSFTSMDKKEQILSAGQKLTVKTGAPVPAPVSLDPMERESLFAPGRSLAPVINPR